MAKSEADAGPENTLALKTGLIVLLMVAEATDRVASEAVEAGKTIFAIGNWHVESQDALMHVERSRVTAE